MLNHILDLVESFDDDRGVNQLAYCATYRLIQCVLGKKAADHFSKHVDASDNLFYLRPDVNVHELKDSLVKIWRN